MITTINKKKDNDLNVLKHKNKEIYIIAYTPKRKKYIPDEDKTITVVEGLCIVDTFGKRNRAGFLLEVDLDDYELFEGEITIKN